MEDKKAEIWNDNKGKSGVYRWINTVTGSSYVGGSTVLNRRIKCYLDTNYLPPPTFFFIYCYSFFIHEWIKRTNRWKKKNVKALLFF